MGVCGSFLGIFLFYPGVINPDTYNQYCQMEIGIIGDWHPPIMLATWKLFRWLYFIATGETIRGEGFLYVSWTLLLWGGLFLILRSNPSFWHNKGKFQKPWWVVAGIIFVLMWLSLDLFDKPHIITKDTGMLANYLFAVGCLMNLPTKKPLRWGVALIVLFCLFYGTAVRHNAVFSVIPLLYWLIRSMIPWKKMVVVVPGTLILWGGMLAMIHFINYDFIGAVRLYPLHERFYADIFQLNARTDRFMMPPDTFGNDFSKLNEKVFRDLYLKEKLFIRYAFEKLNERFSDNIFLFDHAVFVFDCSTDVIMPGVSPSDQESKVASRSTPDFYGNSRDYSDAGKHLVHFTDEEFVRTQYPRDYLILRKAWMDRLLQDPVAYIKFKTYFFIRYCKVSSLYFWGLNPFFLMPLVFLIAVSPMFADAPFNRSAFPSVMLAWSALLYILPLWLFLPDDSFRYLLWFFAASLTSIVMFCHASPLIRSLLRKTVHGVTMVFRPGTNTRS